MKSPLQIYNEVAKEFGITPNKQVHARQKKAYFEAQSQEQKAIINRLLSDIAITQVEYEKLQDDASKAAYRQKIAKYEDDLRQLSAALDISLQFEKELSDENPDLGSTPADHPEGQ